MILPAIPLVLSGLCRYPDMQAALGPVLRRFITRGRLRVRWPDDASLPTLARLTLALPGLAFNDRRTVRRLILNPDMALGEAYMDGGLIPVDAASTRC